MIRKCLPHQRRAKRLGILPISRDQMLLCPGTTSLQDAFAKTLDSLTCPLTTTASTKDPSAPISPDW